MLAQNEEDSRAGAGVDRSGPKGRRRGATLQHTWDLQELDIRIEREEGQRVVELLQHIHTEHGKEPHVAEALYGVYARLGMVGPDGRVRMPTGGPGQPLPSVLTPGAAADPGKLWTPDSETAGTKKSRPMGAGIGFQVTVPGSGIDGDWTSRR